MVAYTDIPVPKEMSKRIGDAWRKGYAAFLNNKNKKDCPYLCSRMAMAYYRSWGRGWEMAKSETEFLSD
jgi:ribosome modulation factor